MNLPKNPFLKGKFITNWFYSVGFVCWAGVMIERRQGLKLSRMNWAGFKYLVGHRFHPNHKRFKFHIYFFHETKSVCLHCIRLSFTKISVTFKVWTGDWWWNGTGGSPVLISRGKMNIYLLPKSFSSQTNHIGIFKSTNINWTRRNDRK